MSRLLDEGAFQRFKAQVNGALAGGWELVDGASKLTQDIASLMPDGLRRVAAPERAGRKGKVVEKPVVSRGAAKPNKVTRGGEREAAAGVAVAGHQFL